MRAIVPLALLLAACGSPASEPTTVEPEPDPPAEPEETAVTETRRAEASDADTRAFAASTRAFGVDLWRRLRSRDGDLVISPASLSIGLAMTWGGARGETAHQMAETLHLGEDPGGLHRAAHAQLARWQDPRGYELHVANRLFAQQGTPLEDGFVTLTRERYGAPIERLDFGQREATRARINAWVDERTRGRIDELLPSGSIDALTRLVLTNAVYFLGEWRTRFDADDTRDAPFHADGGGAHPVPTMHVTERFRHARADGVQVLEMPYAGEALAMAVILPDARDGLGALEEGLSVERLDGWLEALRERQVEVALPRFRIEMDAPLQLKPVLREMGMPLAFTPQADFRAMSAPESPDEDLFIDDVYHRAFLEVNEEGTEAAAATAVVMRARGGPPTHDATPRFVADHPFLFVLRDLETGAILFMGRVTDPR
ncbi:MAG TPA: serpin family protein [Sandaracinaceae bacterium LLY-WYZ-13_1]|nr:serpin family protein [Sandaracinaceae bacterium LLY-WYZ-13_1]